MLHQLVKVFGVESYEGRGRSLANTIVGRIMPTLELERYSESDLRWHSEYYQIPTMPTVSENLQSTPNVSVGQYVI